MSDRPQSIQSVSSRPNSPDFSTATMNYILGGVAIALPILFILGVRGYRSYRTRILSQQIEMLERIWQLDFQKKRGL
jgi:hypothetical protein